MRLEELGYKNVDPCKAQSTYTSIMNSTDNPRNRYKDIKPISAKRRRERMTSLEAGEVCPEVCRPSERICPSRESIGQTWSSLRVGGRSLVKTECQKGRSTAGKFRAIPQGLT
jgi:hypothetical protein